MGTAEGGGGREGGSVVVAPDSRVEWAANLASKLLFSMKDSILCTQHILSYSTKVYSINITFCKVYNYCKQPLRLLATGSKKPGYATAWPGFLQSRIDYLTILPQFKQ